MKHVHFDYVNKFSCLAGACPDTCCKDWEIILDEDTLARYQELPGAFGDDVRAALAEVTLEEAKAKAAAALNGDYYNSADR